MKKRIAVIAVIGVLLAGLGMLIFAWNSQPKLVEVYPQDGAADIQTTTPLRLVFSSRMQEESVNSRISIEPAIRGNFSWENDGLTFTPSQPWPGGQTIHITLSRGARADNWLSISMKQQSWSFSTSSEKLAYLWPSDGQADLYTLNPLNGNIQCFTDGMRVLDYCVSSSGMVFYFSAGNARGGASLYRLSRAGAAGGVDSAGQVEQLLDCGAAQCRSPVISADDQYVAYEYVMPGVGGASTAAQIWMLYLTSEQSEPIGSERHETLQPSWSSSGLLAYYDRSSQGYEIYNPQDESRIFLANPTGQPGAWSPDGEYYLAPDVTYTQYPNGAEAGVSQLIRYDVHSQGGENLSWSGFVEDVDAVYTGDGSRVVFTRKFLDTENWTPGRQVWIMNADGSGAQAITSEADYNHYDLAVSLDSRMVAYVRFNQVTIADPPELWVANADGSNPVQLVIGGYSPTWIP